MGRLLIDKRELAQLLGVSERSARKAINAVIKQQQATGVYIIPSKPPKAPRQKVFEYLGLKEDKQ